MYKFIRLSVEILFLSKSICRRYALWVKDNESYKYYRESLAEAGAIYITSQLSPEKGVYFDTESNIKNINDLKNNNFDIYVEVERYYSNLLIG